MEVADYDESFELRLANEMPINKVEIFDYQHIVRNIILGITRLTGRGGGF